LSVEAFRLQNFMPFEDTGWIELSPICLLFGRNSSGKSAIIRALRLLKQSLKGESSESPFVFVDEYGVDLGSFRNMVHREIVPGRDEDEDEDRTLFFSVRFRCTLEQNLDVLHSKINEARTRNGLSPITPTEMTDEVEVRLSYAGKATSYIWLWRVEIRVELANISDVDGSILVFDAFFDPEELLDHDLEEWGFASEVFAGYSEDETAFTGVSIGTTSGFLPELVVRNLYSETKYQDDLRILRSILIETNQSIRNFLETLAYLGPMRPKPQRVFTLDPITRLHWARLGWSAFLRFLKGDIDDAASEQIAVWMQALDLGDQIRSDKENYAGDLAVVAQVKIKDSESVPINLVDTGYGASQVLPIIVECILAERDVLVIIEQPELHLHPRAQARLADLFIEVAMRVTRLVERQKDHGLRLPTKNERKSIRVRFLIETHSEHILLRLRRRIAESSRGKLKPSESKYLHDNALSVYFIDPDQKPQQSIVEPISIDARGAMKTPHNFRGFFADDLRETAFLAGARLGVNVDWGDEDDPGD
jgi:predicted ATPase